MPAKRTGNYTDWCDYKQARNEVNSLLETAYHNYCANLFNDSSTSKKRFWSYIKAKRKDNTGVAPLKDGQTVCTNAKQKACILNNQFQSVFTAEDLLNTPQLDYSIHPSMENLSFTTHNIQLLLEKLDPAKAPGPDHIPTKAIKLCANVIAPVLQIIYSQSLDHATLPQEWLSANIIPIFKKRDQNIPVNCRPIPLTSVLCKVMEHIIFHHIRNVIFYVTKYLEPPTAWT